MSKIAELVKPLSAFKENIKQLSMVSISLHITCNQIP